jgi:hypothetical protein
VSHYAASYRPLSDLVAQPLRPLRRDVMEGYLERFERVLSSVDGV